jgi:predicted nicotinamide N-methyase
MLAAGMPKHRLGLRPGHGQHAAARRRACGMHPGSWHRIWHGMPATARYRPPPPLVVESYTRLR